MSFHFYVQATRTPPPEDILSRLPGVAVVSEEEQPTGLWPEHLQLHVPRRSTRGVGLSIEDGRFEIRLNTLASPEDHRLAVDLAAALSEATGEPVEAEDGDGPLSPADLRDRYDGRWIDDQVQSAVTLLFHLVDDPSRHVALPISLPGPFRDFCVGARFAADIRRGDPAHLADRVLDAARRVQYAHFDDAYFAASVMRIRRPDGEAMDGSVFAPEVRYLFSGAQYVILMPADNATMFVPYACLPELAGDRFQWLDERHSLVESFSEPEYRRLVDRARRFEAFSTGGQKRRWWWPFS